MSGRITAVEIPLLQPNGECTATFRLLCRPAQTRWRGTDALLDLRDDPDLEGASAVQVLEDIEYRYEVDGLDGGVRLEPREIFDADDSSERTGRVRPGRRTGTIPVAVLDQMGNLIGRCDIEVRSRKLSYLDDYRWMLGRIADEATEALMLRFAASEIRVAPTQGGSPRTLYQRFALLKALIESETLDGAVSLVTNRPHVEYRGELERAQPQRGLRPGRETIKALTGPGPRIHAPVTTLRTVPSEVDRTVHVESLDTVPNRFVKHALERWLSMVIDIRALLEGSAKASDRRGMREALALESWLSSRLNAPKLRDVGELSSFPAGNQVLQRREGYRDVFRSYLMIEVAADLDWSGGDDVFRAGQRNVATLYEYWVFLELARVISTVIGQPMDTSQLFAVQNGGLSLNLSRDRSEAVIRGSVERRGQEISLELFFNRHFGKHESWTTPVRPDCSLRISVVGKAASATWLHFDAKYRLHELTEVLAEPISGREATEPTIVRSATAKSDDLLKMHSYRDAVRRTSGAYVLYPGTDDKPDKQMFKYHEVLPGLGAFVLRPTSDGKGSNAGTQALSRFINDALDHVSAAGTSRERARYWEQKSYRPWQEDSDAAERRLDPAPFLEMPADDELVLLGYVKSAEHRQWVMNNFQYNVRADEGRQGAVGLDSAELRASLIILYNPTRDRADLLRLDGTLFLRTAADLLASGYPAPGGERYLCMGLEPLEIDLPLSADIAAVARQGRTKSQWASPRVMSWAEFQASLQEVPDERAV